MKMPSRTEAIWKRSWRAGFLFAWICLLVPSAQASTTETPTQEETEPEYGLDNVSREVSPKGRVQCPKVPMVRYEGKILRYRRPIRVYTGFQERLEKFEALVREVAIEVYGRAPKTIVHMGTYNCRRIKGYPNLVSEHGMGNGIDIAGFNFGRLGKDEVLPEGLPRRLRRGFKVRLLDHWDGKKGANKVHARFLRTLARRLIDGEEIFRVILGPSFPGHKNHFHLDCAPYTMIDVF
tara:strand:+ start:337 stop:1044 length:708 start_codon:yes stop_codon:yes gene_type:complete